MSQDITDDHSTLGRVMAWCRQQQAITWTNVDQDLQRHMASLGPNELTHLPLVQRIYISVSIGSDNGLMPIRCQTVFITNGELLSIGPLGTNFSVILIKIQNFSFKVATENIICEMAPILSRGRWFNRGTKPDMFQWWHILSSIIIS